MSETGGQPPVLDSQQMEALVAQVSEVLRLGDLRQFAEDTLAGARQLNMTIGDTQEQLVALEARATAEAEGRVARVTGVLDGHREQVTVLRDQAVGAAGAYRPNQDTLVGMKYVLTDPQPKRLKRVAIVLARL